MDYSFCTFVTSVIILLLQLKSFEDGRRASSPPYVDTDHLTDTYAGTAQFSTSKREKRVVIRDGYEVYEDGEIPHPSYVVVARLDEEQSPLNLDLELERLRVAANTQREILVAANRMPPETPVSRMIAETTRKYMQEDRERRHANNGSRYPEKKPTQSNHPSKDISQMKQIRPESSPLVPGSSPPSTGKRPPSSPVLHHGANINSIGPFLSQRYPGTLGIIIGVGRGEFVEKLLSQWMNVGGLYLVDPYIHLWRGYDDPSNVDDKTHQLIFENLRSRLVPYAGKHAFIRDFSFEFSKTYIKSNQPSPAVVWIDANHSYKAVKRDINDWYPIVAAGGFIGGTEYGSKQFEGVKRAVDEFVALTNGLVLNLIEESNIWFIIKV
jgi:hypothetical protein